MLQTPDALHLPLVYIHWLLLIGRESLFRGDSAMKQQSALPCIYERSQPEHIHFSIDLIENHIIKKKGCKTTDHLRNHASK
jgi:hypothetical protein